MKKNISINLQGLIFHIEEDGYEVLQRYLQDVKAHFNTFRGHEEIVADIEGRIAEIFAARTSATKQVITFEDVEAMMSKMGRVQDFQNDGSLDEDDDVADTASYGQPLGGQQQAYAGATSTARPATGTVPPVVDEPRRLYRDMSNRRMAGVAAGLARYFNVNPLWIRLAFVLTLLSPIVGDFVGALPAISILTYVVLWISLPKRYDNDSPMPDDDVTRKLYRDTDNGSIGGVASGLAHYLGIEVAIVRIVFVLLVLFGGSGLLLYLILWMVVPPALTLSQKAQMRGQAVTLSGLENSLRNPAQPANRPVGAFLEEVARAVRPIVKALGTVARIFVGLMFLLTGFALLMGLLVLVGVALGLLPESQNIHLGDAPAYTVLAGVPWWFVVSGFLAAGVPVLLLLFSGVGLIVRRWLLGRTLTLVLLGLWMLGIVGSIMGGVRYSQEFQEEGYFTATRNLGTIANPVVTLDTRTFDYDGWDMRPDLTLAAADSGNTITLVEDYSAHGRTEAIGAALARTSMGYRAVVRDTTVLLDDRFTFKPGAIFRGQELNLTLRIPRNKRIRLSRDFERMLDDDNFVNGHRPNEPGQHTYELVGRQLRCLDCAPGDIPEDHEDEDYSGDDVHVGDMRVHVDTDNDDDVRVSVDYDGDVNFSTEPGDYGSEQQSFSFTDFDDVAVSGAYRVVIRRADTYSVKAYGSERALRELDAESPGDELHLRPNHRGFFNFGSRNDARNRVLLVVEMPTLKQLNLSGAVQAKVTGFDNSDDLSVDQSGASHLSFEGTVRRLALDMGGACRTNLKGRADRLDIDGSGVCQVQAANFPVQSADVELSGASKARLNVENELRTDLSGASQVDYNGSPTNVRNQKSGASRVRRVE
ncbi:PspC domain-containing protein [Hymenobacter sp. 15J16-1T3B]|uniref:PspC domain-containing protein n=1 Tax=Hymenobacter sp. 15J16-1T3B TaxID=2886941 RepID=UPI001D11C428|nr:PspC domain-containing protein [Hymenobacter sp. 15J16-1T3B]MCC3159461.1 PspC domain-containing protein [Hymenobacter sp. 15J16-1T3B]